MSELRPPLVLPLLADFFKLLFMHQHKYNNLPVSFGDTWITNVERREDNEYLPALRNQEDYYVPFTRLQSTDIHPLIYFPKLWNNFPSEIQSTSNQNIFKKELKAHFLDQLSDNLSVVVCSALIVIYDFLNLPSGRRLWVSWSCLLWV